MTPLQQEPSAHAPWMRTIFGRAFISEIPSRSCLVGRSDYAFEPGGAVSAALLHFGKADARGVRPLATRKATGRSAQFFLSERSEGQPTCPFCDPLGGCPMKSSSTWLTSS